MRAQVAQKMRTTASGVAQKMRASGKDSKKPAFDPVFDSFLWHFPDKQKETRAYFV